jgi:hypothetical protein
MNRAYSILTVKDVRKDQRIVTGIATTPSVDRVGDIIEPLGVRFVNPLPFLWQHFHDKPIGTCEFGTPTAAGIPFTATIADPAKATSAALKDRLHEAWDSITMGLVRATSIGFRPIEYSYIEGGGVRYTETEVFELSAVTIPAQAEAIMEAVKSAQRRTLSGGAVRSRTAASSRVVRLTAKDQRQAQIQADANQRAAARKRLGIPLPVIKISEEERAAAIAESLVQLAREKRAGARKPLKVVKL